MKKRDAYFYWRERYLALAHAVHCLDGALCNADDHGIAEGLDAARVVMVDDWMPPEPVEFIGDDGLRRGPRHDIDAGF